MTLAITTSQGGQDSGEPNAGRDDSLTDPIDYRVNGTHAQVASVVDEGYGCAADTACNRCHYHAHEQDQDGEKATKLVLPKGSKCYQGRNHVDKDRWAEGPYEYVFPHVAECVQGRPLREEDDLLECFVHLTEDTSTTSFNCVVFHGWAWRYPRDPKKDWYDMGYQSI